MTVDQAIEHFGTREKLAEALGRTRQATYHWEDGIPEAVQYQIQVITGGRLQADAPKRKR